MQCFLQRDKHAQVTRKEYSHGFVVSGRLAGSESDANIRHKVAYLVRKTGESTAMFVSEKAREVKGMSLEDQINRLANVISMSQEGTAVAEIIRQRDAALKEAQRQKSEADWYMKLRNENCQKLETERRRTRALRAYINRLKTKA